MMNFAELAPTPSDHPLPRSDGLGEMAARESLRDDLEKVHDQSVWLVTSPVGV